MSLFEPLFAALSGAGARYVVVGGLATVLHGYARLTADVDLVVDLEPAAAKGLVRVLTALGFVPQAPVPALQFADAAAREQWVREKGMRVFSLFDPGNPMRTVDLFVENPIPFADLWQRAEVVRLGQTEVRIASIPDLVRLKELAGRPQDLEDIRMLRRIEERRAERHHG